MWSWQSCVTPCDSSLNEAVGDEYFTVEYRTPAGDNYLDKVYNPSNVVVYMDPSGGKDPVPNFVLVQPAFEEGKFGPFRFTADFIDPATQQLNTIKLYGQAYKFDYYIKKDTYGTDTISVEFLMQVDECNNSWRYIRYAINGIPQPNLEMNQQAEIVIVE
ncbi:MAG: hypothetical protein D6730_07980 [Bacteroidetes bacterium]|nr:MAG: hypothetical protein D6730_07980 [Bacteroidota bacterium]